MLYFIIFSLIATVIASLLGSLLTLINRLFNKKAENFIQNFSVGVIIGLLFIDIIPEIFSNFNLAFKENKFLSIFIPILIILGSGLLFFFLHEILHKLGDHHKHDENDDDVCEDHAHIDEIFRENKSLFISTLIFFFSISIHNIPEGLSLGTSFIINSTMSIPLTGIMFSIALFIHNFFISYTMCSSFKKAGKSYGISLLLTLLSSIPSLLFSYLGYFISFANMELVNGIIYAISSGTLLYCIFVELLPQIYYKYKSKYSFIFILIGILAAFLIILVG